ncbi:glycerol-3-phosphate acyltransferase [Ureibacillus acetophenoni]|uniref:Glycerol-3-phosphate acyltransferase n=1 Tax=Ureibacillus acetophenoni TaxID=614649 RepID=A0A285UK71_9BACL|nr:glycerol-3-phosphate acyltransferase [Ureibacillus acetophenoni]SOC42295.1 glycerol-3-phosphate acyltransferase PlsY [Ureibacillus acetophenoni]
MVFASLTVLIAGYLIGCFLGSNIVHFLTGVNLKNTGSKNAGATNAVISLGWKYGILVVIIDIGKAILAILLVKNIFSNFYFTPDEIVILSYITGAAVILGHNFPFHMNFNGGKGTASLVGLLIAMGWKVGLLAIISFFAFAFIFNYLIVGVFQLYIILIIQAFNESTIIPAFISIILFIVAIFLHIENITRIREGKEPKMSLIYKRT